MLIDINRYVDIVMEKLDSIDFYSELSKNELEAVVHKKLSNIYNEKITALSLQFDIDKHRGLLIDNERYKKEYDKIRREILTEAHDIALSSKLSLPALPKI